MYSFIHHSFSSMHFWDFIETKFDNFENSTQIINFIHQYINDLNDAFISMENHSNIYGYNYDAALFMKSWCSTVRDFFSPIDDLYIPISTSSGEIIIDTKLLNIDNHVDIWIQRTDLWNTRLYHISNLLHLKHFNLSPTKRRKIQ